MMNHLLYLHRISVDHQRWRMIKCLPYEVIQEE